MTSSLTEYDFVTIAIKKELRDQLSARLKKLNLKDNNPATKKWTVTSMIDQLLETKLEEET